MHLDGLPLDQTGPDVVETKASGTAETNTKKGEKRAAESTWH